MKRWCGALFFVVSSWAGVAEADAIMFAPSCPPGSHARADHGGNWCAPARCATDADCEGHEACIEWRVCARSFEAHVPSRMRRDPPDMRTIEQVTGSCAPSESCAGTEEPAPGWGSGEITCAVALSCVPRPRPALPLPLGEVAPTPPAPSPPTAAATPTAAPAPEESGGLCSARSGTGGSGFFVLVVAAIVLARRTRALAVLSLVIAGGAAAQTVPSLPVGWHEESVGGFAPRGMACDATHAWVRDWDGSLSDVRREVAPSVRVDAAAYATTFALAPDGTFFLSGREGLVRRATDGTITTFALPSTFAGDVQAIFAPSASEVFAVGERGRLLRLVDGVLVDHDSTTWRELLAIDGADAGDFWIGSTDGVLFHRTRSGMERVEGPIRSRVETIVAFAADDVWAATEHQSSSREADFGGAMHWDGTAWSIRNAGLEDDATFETFVRVEGDVLAGGSFGVRRWDGTSWVEELPAATFMPSLGCARGREAVFVDGWHHAVVREAR